MKIIFKTLFFSALLLGFFSSALYAVSELYCLFNNCGTNSIYEVIIPGLVALVWGALLLNCVKKPRGKRLIDYYAVHSGGLFSHIMMDAIVLIALVSFVRTFFGDLHTEYIAKIHEIIPDWHFRIMIYPIILFPLTITRLMLLRVTLDPNSSDVSTQQDNN